MKLIENLQNKPRYIRIQILWLSVILVMAIIFFFWLIYLKSNLLGLHQEEIQKEESAPSLFNIMREDFSFLKKNLQAEVKRLIEPQNTKSKFEVEIIK